MVSLLADGLATLTLLVARIPLIQKLAILCSFWIISIFVSVVTLHPIILAYTAYAYWVFRGKVDPTEGYH